jgi:hypothetical protein
MGLHIGVKENFCNDEIVEIGDLNCSENLLSKLPV